MEAQSNSTQARCSWGPQAQRARAAVRHRLVVAAEAAQRQLDHLARPEARRRARALPQQRAARVAQPRIEAAPKLGR
eukprot:4159419-Prymnesium_polylepis.1